MEDLSSLFRVWVLSIVLGAAAGLTCGIGLLGFMFVTGGIANGFYFGASVGFAAGFVLCVVLGAVLGAAVGAVIGFLSGGLAAPAFVVFQRVSSHRVAAGATVALVLASQTVVGLLVVEPRVWWTALIVPAISVAPLALAVGSARFATSRLGQGATEGSTAHNL